MNLRQYEEKNVRLVDVDNDVYIGYAFDYVFPDDNEPEGFESISIRCKDGRTIEFYDYEIKSITIL